MFKGRKVELKVVKDRTKILPPNTQVVVKKLDLDEAVVYTTLAVSTVIGVYFLGSTFRACAVHAVAVKVTA